MQASQFELLLLANGEPAVILPVGTSVLAMGRGPGNQLVSGDPEVSSRHAEVWVEGSRLFIRDLASRNGTWVNGERVVGPRPVDDGDRIRIGTSTLIEVRRVGSAVAGFAPVFRVELAGGNEVTLGPTGLSIGDQPEDDIRLSDVGGARARLAMDEHYQVWIFADGKRRMLSIGEEFTVGPRRFRLTRASDDYLSTMQEGPPAPPYLVSGRFLPNGEPAVEVRGGPLAWRCDGGNRALLVFLLSRQVQRDRDEGRAGLDEGWLADEDVLTGIWGRKGDSNKLYVLLHRVRTELEEAGLDGRCIQKQPGMTRILASTVQLAARPLPGRS